MTKKNKNKKKKQNDDCVVIVQILLFSIGEFIQSVYLSIDSSSRLSISSNF